MTEYRPGGGLWFSTKELAEAFFVTPRTVRRWVSTKLLEPRYRLRGGSSYELVFLNSEVSRFLDEYLPSGKNLIDPTWSKSRSRKERADRLRRLMNMNRLYAGRLNGLQPAKESGLEGKEIEAQEKEPVIVDQRPSGGPRSPRGSMVQAGGAGGDKRSLWSSRDEEDEDI